VECGPWGVEECRESVRDETQEKRRKQEIKRRKKKNKVIKEQVVKLLIKNKGRVHVMQSWCPSPIGTRH
jgi:hypothetical protein